MFIAFYFLLIILLVYFQNKKTFFEVPKKTKNYSLSVLVPAYNEESTIEKTIKHIFDSGYVGLKEIIAINDGSTDGTLDILRRLEKKHKKLRILDKKNSGKADSLNKAIKLTRAELVAVVDADSYPAKGAFDKLMGFFDDPKVGGATATALTRNRNNLLEKMQAIEYKVVAFTRKILDYLDSVYVTPGSLSVYRKTALEDIGGFDTKNITEDIEATWHLLHNGWDTRMCLDSYAKTTVPNTIKPWYKQRRRWALGGLQVLSKYKKDFINHKGMLGYFIVPFFGLGLLLGLAGMGVFTYVFGRRFLRQYLITKYSVDVGVPILTVNDFYLTPTVINYFGIILFFLFFLFTILVLGVLKDNVLEKQSFFNLIFYMTVYLLVYPIVTIASIIHYTRGKWEW